MGVSLLLCLLPALLATASAQAGALTCESCSGMEAACETTTGTCSVRKGAGGCRSLAGETTLSGTPATGYVKGCLPDYNSGIKGPLTLTVGRGLYLRLNTSRCNATEKCNTALLAVPQENSTLNGLQCPACLARNASACTGQAILCTGEETYCIDFTGEIIKGSSLSPFAAKGCASASAQDIESGTFLTAGNSRYLFGQATSTPAERAPTTTPPPTTSLPSTPLPTTATTSGTSPAPGQVPFALCLPGLMGLLVLKLLS